VAEERPMNVKLVVVGGKQTGMESPVKVAEFFIGRGADCRLQLHNNLISRKHCAVVVENDTVIVKDFSSNGTFVNGNRIAKQQEVKTGDHIKVGPFELEVRIAAATPAKPKAAEVQQAAMAARSPSGGKDDVDISGWLKDEQNEAKATVEDAEPSTAASDTTMTKAVDETGALPTTADPKKGKAGSGKIAGQFNRTKKPIADSSRSAAEDTLRKFFNRRS
jgi:predicted component of type VI protein secretion system